MTRLVHIIWCDDCGQDLIEYALLAGLTSIGAAILMPAQVYDNLVLIFSKVDSCLVRFGAG